MTSQNACPNCGHYKLRSSKIPLLSTGIFLGLCGAYLSIWQDFFATLITLFFIASVLCIAIGVFQKGQTCQNCHYRLRPAQ